VVVNGALVVVEVGLTVVVTPADPSQATKTSASTTKTFAHRTMGGAGAARTGFLHVT
jgi:hypothetical protein